MPPPAARRRKRIDPVPRLRRELAEANAEIERQANTIAYLRTLWDNLAAVRAAEAVDA